MIGSNRRTDARLTLILIGLTTIGPGCSEQTDPKVARESRAAAFRKIRFAGDWVIVPFLGGIPTAKVPEPSPGFVPKTGDRVVLSDVGDGEIFVAADLDSLKFYHSSPGPQELERFRSLAEVGKLFIVAKGTTAIVAKAVEGELPDGLRAIELRLAGEKGEKAWVSDTFVRPLVVDPKE